MKKLLFLLLPLAAWGTVFAGVIPTPSLQISPAVGAVGDTFTFTAQHSVGAGNLGLSYRFQFHPGLDWSGWGGASRSFRPTDTGTYRARVQVKNSYGLIQTTYREYRVREEMPRYARITIINPKADVGEEVFFRLHVIVPIGEDIRRTTVRWDFDGDDTWDTGFSSTHLTSHIYPEGNIHIPAAEVRWPNGDTQILQGGYTMPDRWSGYRQEVDWGRVYINQAPALKAPIVNFKPNGTRILKGTTIYFDASESYLPQNGWIEWNFDGGKTVFGKKINRAFLKVGRHTVRTRACYRRSSPKCETTISVIQIYPKPIDFRIELETSIQVTVDSDNSVAEFAQRNLSMTEGTTISFQAKVIREASPVGAVLRYRWDFDGDGYWDTPMTGSSSVSHKFDKRGVYRPRVEVADLRIEDFSKTAIAETKVVIERRQSAYAKTTFIAAPDEVFTDEEVTFQAMVEKKVAIAPYNVPRAEYRWDADGDGLWDTPFGNHTNFEWKYDRSGTYTRAVQC